MRENPIPLCHSKQLCTLCRGSGEQSCLLTIVGANLWAVILPEAGWAVHGSAGT